MAELPLFWGDDESLYRKNRRSYVFIELYNIETAKDIDRSYEWEEGRCCFSLDTTLLMNVVTAITIYVLIVVEIPSDSLDIFAEEETQICNTGDFVYIQRLRLVLLKQNKCIHCLESESVPVQVSSTLKEKRSLHRLLFNVYYVLPYYDW